MIGERRVGLRPATRAQPTVVDASIAAGNFAQISGVLVSVALLHAARSTRHSAVVRLASLIGGWVTVYLSTHAIGHWAVGRACGMRFRGYRLISGTANPEQYPIIMRPVMTRLPFWSVRTVPGSGTRRARAAMFAAGETASAGANLFVAWYAIRHRVPGGRGVAIVLIVWTVLKSVATTRNERGDYAKALRALGHR
jgi:hypothetical protein